jgi:predicted alpha/beta-fold hydrolase
MHYTPPFFLFNRHFETIYPALIRKVDFSFEKKELIPTPDDDVLEIALSSCNSEKLVIISHGLEGSMERPYIRGMAKACLENGFDVMAWNYRGCGMEMNRQLRFYHSGATDDLDTLINYAIKTNRYASINLIGFSLGGNITLKYMGEDRERSSLLQKVMAISVPMDLETSCNKLLQPDNLIYHNRFLKSLKNKIITKSKLMKGLDVSDIERIKTLKAFDDRYTSILHGFSNAAEYYNKCSSIRFVSAIRNKTLILNAANDPFLSKACYPEALVKDHEFVKLEIPMFGGHVGFTQINKKNLYWSEQMAVGFLTAS